MQLEKPEGFLCTENIYMARSRIIKVDFWSDDKLMRISRDARLLFIGMWNFCDDYGFMLHSTRRMLGDIFPLDDNVSDKMLESWLAELIKERMVVKVKYNNSDMLYIKQWEKHQYIQHKSKTRYISPEDYDEVILKIKQSHEDQYKDNIESQLQIEVEVEVEVEGEVKGEVEDNIKGNINKNKNELTKTEKEYSDKIKEWWTECIQGTKLSGLRELSKKRIKKAKAVKIDQYFDELKPMIQNLNDFAQNNSWFSFDWIIKDETNILKLLEGNYDGRKSSTGGISKGRIQPSQENIDKFANVGDVFHCE